jgi:hypothetical protein
MEILAIKMEEVGGVSLCLLGPVYTLTKMKVTPCSPNRFEVS